MLEDLPQGFKNLVSSDPGMTYSTAGRKNLVPLVRKLIEHYFALVSIKDF